MTIPFKSDVSDIPIPKDLNDPFSSDVPALAKTAAEDFQQYILDESAQWGYDFSTQKGKMFGVLVVRDAAGDLYYLATVSGRLTRDITVPAFIPSVFDDSTDGYFINKGMSGLTDIGKQIKTENDPDKISRLEKERRDSSVALQQRLFENYRFHNISGESKNLIDIFQDHPRKMPPSASGECAAPKLLEYAIVNSLNPIAIAEFWWGLPKNDKLHKSFYPACESRCRPILEYMLNI
jgi:tRNA pseudouridine32 synthase/23S rRNA pseudouridine746 synthase